MKDNWIVNEIASITSLLKDGTHGTHINVSDGIPLLSAKDIVNGKISILEDARKISQNDYNSIHSNYLPEVGDVLLTLVGTIGRTAIIKDYSQKFTFQRSVGILRFTKEVYNEYAYHYINSEIFKLELDRATNASAQGGVYLGSLGKIKISYPQSLQKQQKIAKILSTCDEVIEKTEAAIAKYKAIKQGMMHDLFTRGIDTTTGKLRPSYQEAPELYKESALGMIPKEWEVDMLSNLTVMITDGSHFSPVPQEKGLPIGNVKDMTNNGFNIENCTKILPDVFDLLVKQNCSPKKFDVLLSKDGTIGKVIHYLSEFPIVLLSSIAILRVNEILDSGYLSHALQSQYFDKELYKFLSGSALKRITLRDIQKITIPYSISINEQKTIDCKISGINTKLQAEESALQKYKKIKEGLMQDLLTGRVEVSE